MNSRAFLILWLLVLIAAASGTAWAHPVFSLHKLGEKSAPDALVIGGIQGDEPGGFSAASLLVTRYRFTKGTVWIVPNLNFPSIIQRSRGIHGDMNRKFAALPASDPEYAVVQQIQELIRTPKLQLVLNLHDGGGFYRPSHESKNHNPTRWGQCLIIDRGDLPAHPHGDLEQRGLLALRKANSHLIQPDHRLYLKNTLTHLGNPEMEKTLSWYAIQQGVPAFGIEASKNFPVHIRAYYHLLLVEALLQQAGVSFERSFPLTPEGVCNALYSNLHIGLANNRSLLILDDARPQLSGSIPLPRNALDSLLTSNPLLAIMPIEHGRLEVHYGNRTLTRFKPDWCETDAGFPELSLTVDGLPRQVHFGEVVSVAQHFSVNPAEGYRVNAIGADFGRDESGKILRRSDFIGHYSLDRSGTLYRVEIYREARFAGMFLVHFTDHASTSPASALSFATEHNL